VAGTVTVNQAPLTITASSATVSYGGGVPTITPSYSGFVNSQTSSVLTTQPTCTTTYTTTSAAGSSPSTSCSGAAAANYAISYVAGTVTVNQAPLTITASSATVSYGGGVPTITPSYSGFVNSQASAVLTTAPTCTTTYTTVSAAGSSPSTSCSGAAAANYSISYVAGTVTVNQAPPTITFTVSNQTYGVAPFTVSATSNSAGAITYSVVSGPATISGSTVTITGVGTGVLQASQAANGNYTAGTQNASFTVSKATPTVALSSSSNPSTYNGSVTFTATVPPSATGIVTFLDGATSIGTGSVSSGAATFTMASLSGGSHSITAQYGGNSNYNAATSSAVTEVVDRTPVTVSIISTENPSIYWDMVTFTFTFTGSGSAIPTGTATITEDGNALTTVTLDGTGKATYSTSATTAGSHNIKAAYNGDDNYQ
jgi:hypothetical protein